MESVEDSSPEEYDLQYHELELQEFVERQLMMERKEKLGISKGKIDPSQLITPAGTLVKRRVAEDTLPEVNMVYHEGPPFFWRNRPPY